jgi:hypothetical protein
VRLLNESSTPPRSNITQLECYSNRSAGTSHPLTLRLPDPEHTGNHSLSGAITAYPARRIAVLAPDTRAYINSLSRSGLLPTQVLTTLRVAQVFGVQTTIGLAWRFNKQGGAI